MIKIMVVACYDHGVDHGKDIAAEKIAEQFGAELDGSGCWLLEPFTRDLAFTVDAANAQAFAAELTQDGFKCVVHDDDN